MLCIGPIAAEILNAALAKGAINHNKFELNADREMNMLATA